MLNWGVLRERSDSALNKVYTCSRTMLAIVSPKKIQLPVGAVIRLPASWQDYQTLTEQRGDSSIPRIKYRQGEVLLMSPLPQHGRDAHLMASIITTLLDYLEREYDAFTPLTMELPRESGIEPDYCFYIDNWEAVSGKKRIDWQVEPPPDLVLEVDVTSYCPPQYCSDKYPPHPHGNQFPC